jgi:hypothetical protein
MAATRKEYCPLFIREAALQSDRPAKITQNDDLSRPPIPDGRKRLPLPAAVVAKHSRRHNPLLIRGGVAFRSHKYFKHLQHAIGRVKARIFGFAPAKQQYDRERWNSLPRRLSNMGG